MAKTFMLVAALALLASATALRSLYARGFEEAEVLPAKNPALIMNHVAKEQGHLAAQNLAKTNLGNLTSYAGFLEVNQTKGNSLFVWYFPALNGNKNAPLLIWLQGGPGGASTFGLFSEIGPFSINANQQLEPRNTTWNEEYSLLFIDNPVGAGFSFTAKNGWATNSRVDAAEDLYSCLQAFYQVFPSELKNDLYITGESYAGHYIPAFGAYVHNQNKAGQKPEIPLKGVSIGDGWTVPHLQMQAIPGLMFNLGLADDVQTAQLEEYSLQAINYITAGDYKAAFDVWDLMLNGDVWPYATYFYNLTGCTDYDNFLRTDGPVSFGYYSAFLQAHRDDIHVGNATLNSGLECEMHLINDVMDSYQPELELLMENYKVLLYNGQLDLIVGVPLTEQYIPHLNWSGSKGFAAADRTVWKVEAADEQVAGYARSYKNFTQVVVRGAGHIAPFDQGRSVKDMVTRFVENKAF